MWKYKFNVICGDDIMKRFTETIHADTQEEAWKIIKNKYPDCEIESLDPPEINTKITI